MQEPKEVISRWQLPFFTIWTGQAFSLVGSRLVQFALVWWLTETTGSATVLATGTLVAVLPGVILGPFAGALVDRWDRKRVMLAADAFVALVSAWLAYLFWRESLSVWHVYVAMFAFVINPAFSLMPLLVTGHFGGGALELGGLQSAWGSGAVVGGLVLSVWGGTRRRILTTLGGLVFGGLGVMVVGLTPAALFPLALGALFVSGFMNPLINGPVFAILQSTVAPEMQGRVFTLVTSAAMAMMPLSLAVAGPVADVVGVRPWFVVGGALFSLLGGWVFSCRPWCTWKRGCQNICFNMIFIIEVLTIALFRGTMCPINRPFRTDVKRGTA